MSDETPTNDPATTPAPETPAAPVAETPAPAPAAETPAAPVAETPAPVAAMADTQPEIPAAAAAATQPEIPVAAAPGYAAPVAPVASPVAEPVTAAPAPSSSHVAVPKWVLATVAGVLGAAVMFGIGYAVGDGSSSDDNNAPVGAPFGNQGDGTQQMPGFPGGNQGGGNQQAPGFPGGNQGGTDSPGGSQSTSGAFLGVATQQATNGLEIVQVVSGSAADDAGLEVGDVIVEFDGNRVTTPAQLANAVSSYDVGDELEITYERDGSSDTVTVELGSRSAANSN